ncbi:hypothetical protein JL720_5825 [Aureococcus anophagefferens]|nr:hypothetical protein JL720_5825 [Aureococcus anophagefferens]
MDDEVDVAAVQGELWERLAGQQPLTAGFERTLAKLLARPYAAVAAAPARAGDATFGFAARVLGDVTAGTDGCAPFAGRHRGRRRGLRGAPAASASSRVDAYSVFMGLANLVKCHPGPGADVAALGVAAAAAARVAGEPAYGAEARRQACRVLSEAPMLYGSGEPPSAAERKAAKRAAKKDAKKTAKKAGDGDATLYLPATSREAASARLRAQSFTALGHLFACAASAARVAELAGRAFAEAAERQLSAEGRAATPADEFPKTARKVATCYGNSTRDDGVWGAISRDADAYLVGLVALLAVVDVPPDLASMSQHRDFFDTSDKASMITAPAGVAACSLHYTLDRARRDVTTFRAHLATLAKANLGETLVAALEAAEPEVASEAAKLAVELLGQKTIDGPGRAAAVAVVAADPAFHVLRLEEHKGFVKAAVKLARAPGRECYGAGLVSAIAEQARGTAGLNRCGKAGASLALAGTALPRLVAGWRAGDRDAFGVQAVVLALHRLSRLPSEAAKIAGAAGAVDALAAAAALAAEARRPRGSGTSRRASSRSARAAGPARRRILESGAAAAALDQVRRDPDALLRTVPMENTDGLVVPKIYALTLVGNLCDEKRWITTTVARDDKFLRCVLAALRSDAVAGAAAVGAHVLGGLARAARGDDSRAALWRRFRVHEAVVRAAVARLDGRSEAGFVDQQKQSDVGALEDGLVESALHVLTFDSLERDDDSRAALRDAGAGRILEHALRDAESSLARRMAPLAPLLRLQLGVASGDAAAWTAAARSLAATVTDHVYHDGSSGDKVLDGIRAERDNENRRVWQCDNPACEAAAAPSAQLLNSRHSVMGASPDIAPPRTEATSLAPASAPRFKSATS